MREEVMLRTLQASILTDAIVRSNVRSNAMLCSTMVSSKFQELKIFQGDVMLERKQEEDLG